MNIQNRIRSWDEVARWLGKNDVAGPSQLSMGVTQDACLWPQPLTHLQLATQRLGVERNMVICQVSFESSQNLMQMLAILLPQPPYALLWALISSLVNTQIVLVLIAQQNPLTALLCEDDRGKTAASFPFLAIGGIWDICTEPARWQNWEGPGQHRPCNLPVNAASHDCFLCQFCICSPVVLTLNICWRRKQTEAITDA